MNFLKIESSSLSNGQGWRVVLWCSGCIHQCYRCQNPESWDPKAGREFTRNEMDLLIELLKPDYIKGLTISGGDPLFDGNTETVTAICRELKEKLPDKDIWVYTGYEYDAVKDLELMNYIDVLIDGRFINSLRNVALAFRGSSNQKVIDVPASRKCGGTVTLNVE